MMNDAKLYKICLEALRFQIGEYKPIVSEYMTSAINSMNLRKVMSDNEYAAMYANSHSPKIHEAILILERRLAVMNETDPEPRITVRRITRRPQTRRRQTVNR